MPKRNLLYGLMVICFTVLIFTWMVRDTLCELHLKRGNTEFAAILAYEVKR